jgi:hypothetical protein
MFVTARDSRQLVAAIIFVSAGMVIAGCAPPAGQAGSPPPSAAPSAALFTSAAAEPPHTRSIGPADQAREVVVRFGDVLDVAPPGQPGGWTVTDYPKDILRLHGSAGAGAHHTFVAVAVGEGQIRLVPAAGRGAAFTVRVRVLRDFVQPPQP